MTHWAILLAGIAVYSCSAQAHDAKHPELKDWYGGLHNGNKFPCCDGQEARHLADFDWDTECEQNNFGEKNCHYRVFLHGKWWNVPASSVVDGPNLDGSALVWEVPQWNNAKIFSNEIRCFMPGAGG